MKATLGLLPVFLAITCDLINSSAAAPVITATKDDGLAAGQRTHAGAVISYSIAITNTGDATATDVQLSDPDPGYTFFQAVRTTPIARADSYAATRNVQLSIPAGSGLLANDNDPDATGPALAVSASPTTTSGGGTLSVAANGSFTYKSSPDQIGSDSFTYTMTDGEGKTDTATVSIAVTVPLMAGASDATAPSIVPATSVRIRELSQAELVSLVAEARERWIACGLVAEQISALEALKFEVADLPGRYLGEYGSEGIRVDGDAGGHGWFTGGSSEDEVGFPLQLSSTRRQADAFAASAHHIDLLSVILHEMGHALGLEDSYAQEDREGLMYGFLGTGERRLPAIGQAAGAVPHGGHCRHFLHTPLVIGSLPAGKSVTITHDVQIVYPFTPGVFSQGTVSGSNFSNKLTDDPQTVAVDDQTFTEVNRPPFAIMSGDLEVQEDGGPVGLPPEFFTAHYVDPNGDPLVMLRINSLPSKGVLKFNGSPVVVPKDLVVGDIGKLSYTPNANFHGTDTFLWTPADGVSGFADGGGFFDGRAPGNLTVLPVNDPPQITGQLPLAILEGSDRVLALADLTVTDPDNAYPTGFMLTLADGANYTRAGTTVTPAAGFVGTLSVPVKVNDGAADSSSFNLVLIVNPTDEHIAASGRVMKEPGGGYRIYYLGRPGVVYSIHYSDTLLEWHPLGTATAGADAVFSLPDIPPVGARKRFYRLALP